MKVTKIIIGIVIVLIATLVIAVFIGLKNLDSLVEMAIEDVGTNVVKTPVTVDGVKLELIDGRGEISGLAIQNPHGYRTGNAIELGKIIMQLDPSSLADNVIVIKEMSVDGAKLMAEHKGLADINLQQLYENIAAPNGKHPRNSAPTTARPDIRFMLEKVNFTNISLDLLSPNYGRRQLNMADIHITNVGDKKNGLSVEELANAVLTPVVDAARKRVNNELKDKAKEKLSDKKLQDKKLQDKLERDLSDDDKQRLDSLKSWLDK